jgi:tetratricopeptide (TPR) repeat protein
LVAFSALNVITAYGLKAERRGLKNIYRLNVVPVPPGILKLAAGEFKGMAANLLLLQAAAFIGSNPEPTQEDYKKLALTLEQSLTLDPHFQQTYLYVQAFLPWQARMPEKAIELLDVAAKHRPWDWRPGYYIGFDSYFFLKDFDRASRSFLEAAKVPQAPVLLPLLGARFSVKKGRTESALRLLESMVKDPTVAENDNREITQRIEALKGVLLLQSALASHQEREGKLPESLTELVEKGIIEKMPPNPYGTEYVLDKETGEVHFDTLHLKTQ